MTELAMMPPVVSMSSDDIEDDVAFKVLNQDNLPINIIGETILKPFGRENLKQKPNGIVYPTRRIDSSNLLNEIKSQEIAKSNGHLDSIDDNPKKHLSSSHGNLANNIINANQHDPLAKFSKTLDAKLRKLQRDENNKSSNHHKKSTSNLNQDGSCCYKRPIFVTTVKKGEFLEPPPEIATLFGIKLSSSSQSPDSKIEKKLYAYASQPRVLNRTPSRNLHRGAAVKAASVIAGSVVGVDPNSDDVATDFNCNISKKGLLGDVPLPYQNLMFEKRVHRGSNFAPTLSGHMGDGESAAARAAEARRRALARRKAKNQQVRAAQLRLGSPPPVPGRKHEPVQTDDYLEEIFANPPVAEMCTQTDLFLERPISPFYVPAKTGADVETQIYPGDLFDFDMEVQPILEVLVGKTIEQALIEVLEEEELAALREQQRRFMELRAAETNEVQRLEELERRRGLEKDRRIKEHEAGVLLQREMEERIAAAVLMQGYMADLLPSVLEGLESEGFLTDAIREDIDDSFMPWLMKEVTHELTDMVSSRDVLTDIVREILENRAEIYRALNQEPRSEESEEEGPTQEDIILQDHLKLRKEIAEASATATQENQ